MKVKGSTTKPGFFTKVFFLQLFLVPNVVEVVKAEPAGEP
jgi:hypothetical protein